MPAPPSPPSLDTVIADGRWLAHRYDEVADAVRFRFVDREAHRGVTFLTDAELGEEGDCAFPRGACLSAVKALGLPPARMIVHSAFCCSTLLARAFDLPGTAMGVKEPVILNDVAGLQLRGGDPRQVAAALDVALHLLARPLAPGEAVVVKPSNLTNPALPAVFKLRPDTRALFLHAPLRDFLGSVARKDIEGRAWVRELMWKLISLGQAQRFGFSTEELYRHTDLQVAALGWLAQHALVADMAAAYPDALRTIDSDALMARPAAAMDALGQHFAIRVDGAAVAAGPAFTRHSKSGEAFGAEARQRDRSEGLELHAREIAMVLEWAGQLAAFAGIPTVLPLPLIA